MRARPPLAALLTLALAACAADPVDPQAVPGATPRPVDATQAAVPPVAARETAAARWNALTRAIVGRREPGPLGTARSYALLSVAQYDAVIATGNKVRGVRPSEAAAASAAAGTVLAALYPAEEAVIAAQLQADRTYFSDGRSASNAAYDAGVDVGRHVAAAVLARGAADGSQTAWTGTIPAGPGFWLNAPAPAQPLAPFWGQVRPWLMTSGDQFRPAAPPAFGSPAFLEALAEVRRYTDGRTPAQLQIAQFWQFASGPGGPVGYFTAAAAALAADQRLDERRAARLFAVLHMAVMDASIGCWDAKYAYWYLRPFQADPLVTTPVGRPNFPGYPSAHSCLSAAAVGVLAALFPHAADSLRAQVVEAGEARLYAGLHFRFDVVAGQQLGYHVAALALARAPRGREPIPLE